MTTNSTLSILDTCLFFGSNMDLIMVVETTPSGLEEISRFLSANSWMNKLNMLFKVISLTMEMEHWWDWPLFLFASVRMKKTLWSTQDFRVWQPIMENNPKNARGFWLWFLFGSSTDKSRIGENVLIRHVRIFRQLPRQ